MSPTRRQEIHRLLSEGERSFEQLRQELQSTVSGLEDDLRHLERSLSRGPESLEVDPARCPQCGFVLRRRPGRFATPSRCPSCGNERLEAPRLRVK